ELAVGRRLPRLDAEPALEVVEQLLTAEEHAGDVRADVDDVLADRLALEHLVERGGAEHLGRRDPHQLGDVDHRLLGDVAVLLLGEVQQRDQRRPLAGVAGDDLLGHRHVLVGEPRDERSTLPMIGSTDEMTATASAIMPPRSMWGRVCRFTNEGPRMCMRYGTLEPSETR